MGVFAPQYIQIDVNVLLDTEEDTAIDLFVRVDVGTGDFVFRQISANVKKVLKEKIVKK